MNIKSFIDYIITFDNVDNILENCKTQSEKGFIFERLFDIIIKFGFCDVFNNSQFNHLIGNSNNAKVKILENLNQYLDEKVLSGNSGGCSDITLQNKNDDTYIFISSKYPKSNEDIKKQKSVDYYDIHKIIAMIDDNKDIYKNYKLFLVVPNKKEVLDKVKTANNSSNYITKYMNEYNILDKNDLNKYFLQFKQDIIKNKNENWQSIYLNSKENLILRFHQELITQKTSNLIEEGNKSFLWGCKPRSGKTYCFGGVIIKQLKIKKKINVLIITPAPTETAPQFTNDLFNKFKDFDRFKIHHIEGSKMIDSIEISDNNIFVMSKQLLQKYINDKTILKIKNLKLDIIGFDENHYSGTTDLSKDILTSYSSKNTVKIYLTATYNKPLREWNILSECQMFWDIEDEQICKSILIDNENIKKLKEKHGDDYINKTIIYYTNLGLSINDIFKCYDKMPDLHIITNLFDQQRYEIIKEKLNIENKMGFCFDTLFGLNNLKTRFSFENEVKTILRYISGSHKEEDGEKTIFTRINNICSEKETRLPFTQIWFLPSDNINEISICLKMLMEQDLILKKYDVLCINRKNKDLVKDIKDEINKKEIEAKSRGKFGLILLAGNMLTLGITLNLCDVVILMNNSLSSDKVLQQMYRCMTEGDDKKIGFVIDLNINRVLNTCVNYTIYKNEKSIDDKLKYLITNRLINIDVDMMLNKKINSDMIIKKLMDIWKEDPINSFRTLLKKLDNDYEEFDNSTQKLINKTFTKSLKDDKVTIELKLKDEDDEIQDLPSGKEKVKDENDDSDNEENTSKDKEEKILHISFTKDVLPYIIPLTCILTIKNSNMDFVKMLNDIKDNPELLDTFDDQCLIWWNKKDLINLIKDIVSKYFDKTSNTYNISVQFKMSLQSLIDNPKELLELINDCLKPKAIEKKTFGEVFTPIDFINNKMLKDITEYWLKNKNENIWANEKLTWYDPATGIGNYPITIYYKLMEGLKSKIPNEVERKKHILENQLYMGELNKKNCFVVKQIFNINNELKLNLYEGDTLNIKINEVFKQTKFDIIIGNPPYNEKLTNVGAKPLYNKFIEYYVNKCNMLSFIVPSRWFAGGKGLDKFRKMMINRTDILYIKHYDNASNIFGNTVSIEGGVNYFLIDKDYNGLCDYNGSKVKFNNFDIILDSKYYGIVNKLLTYEKITKIYLGRYFGIESNDKRLNEENSLIKCFVSQQKGFIKYIDKKEIKKEYNFYKVITARANGKNGCFGNIFIGNPNEVHTGSYISFKVSNENEAKSLLSYMKCKLLNLLLSLRKSSQDISEATCKWIPLVPLNKEWNDEEVYKYFKLSEDEIKLVKETKINGYKDLIENIQNTSKELKKVKLKIILKS
jgi:site-specific DNA-methyltransferase (adenine-specific)